MRASTVNGNGKSSRSEPRSIEAILQKQKEEKEEASKPKFLSKSERTALALARRAAEVDAEKAKQTENSLKRDELERKVRNDRYGITDRDGYHHGDRGGGGGRDRNNRGGRNDGYRDLDKDPRDGKRFDMEGIPTGPKAMAKGVGGGKDRLDYGPPRGSSSSRGHNRDGRQTSPPRRDGDRRNRSRERENDSGVEGKGKGAEINDDRDVEMDDLMKPMLPEDGDGTNVPINQALLMHRYLGAKANGRRKIRKMSDKKFNFDWDGTDDTGANEVDPIYRSMVANERTMKGIISGPNGLFGRGHLAGFDTTVQGGVKAPPGAPTGPKAQLEGVMAGPSSVKNLLKKHTRVGGDDRHWSEKTIEEMKERDWRIFREDFSIAARGGYIPLPIRTWKESTIDERILDVIETIGYSEPTPIQRQAIPIGLQNRDLIGIAETGSGKTAAFVIPMLTYIGKLPPLSDDNRHLGPYALVLAPTRELAQQIEGETNKFTKLLGYRCVSIVGGRAMEEQAFNMRFGAEVVVATPGRLKDCIERHILVLSQCTYVVMDEADRMVNLGFEEVLNFILDSLPVSNVKPDTDDAEDPLKMLRSLEEDQGPERNRLYRQTVMFSATMPPAVERLAKKYLRRPANVTIGIAGQAVDTVEQRVEFFNSEDKKKHRLLDILNQGAFEPPIIVFVNQKKGCDVVAKDLLKGGWSATTLHSGKNQEQREAALASLRNGEADVLVATDLAGRGIDVPDVSLVVNFQMANHIEAYVHRIGRTGRAGKRGTALTFVTNDDADVLYDLKQEIMKSPVSRCPPELAKHEAAQQKMTTAMKRRAQELDD